MPWSRAVLSGALFGFFAYATYDLSNLATLRGWPVRLAVVDTAWGTALSNAAAAARRWALGAGRCGAWHEARQGSSLRRPRRDPHQVWLCHCRRHDRPWLRCHSVLQRTDPDAQSAKHLAFDCTRLHLRLHGAVHLKRW